MRGNHLRVLAPARPAVEPTPQAAEEPLGNGGRGRLLSVGEIADDLLEGTQTWEWVKRNVAPNDKLKVGRRRMWWERDVLRWIDAQRVAREG